MAKEIKVKLTEEEVEALQELDCQVESMKAIMVNLIDMHSMDNNTKVIESPMVAAYQKKITQATKEFNSAKDAIVNKYIDNESQKKVTNWEVSYSTCELTYTM